MRESVPFWKRERRALDRGAKAIRGRGAEAAGDLSAVLARITAAARAVGERGVTRRARTLGARVSKVCAIESDRALLARLEHLGLLTEEAVTVLGAGWEEQAREKLEGARRAARGRSMRRLRKALARADRKEARFFRRLAKARRKLESRTAPGSGAKGRELARYRRSQSAKTCLDAVLSSAAAASTVGAAADAARPIALLDRWHTARRLRKRLKRERRAAERRGAVTLVLELDRAISALRRSIETTRRDALRAIATSASNVVQFQRRSA